MPTTIRTLGNAVFSMSTRTTVAPVELPGTIAGLWSLCALTPLRTRARYEEAADLCARLAVRRLNPAQREYQRELLALVDAYEQTHNEEGKALAALRKLARV